jgi:hypothetical protein
MMIDWTFGLLFQPDIVKVGLDSETASLLRKIGLRETAVAQLAASARLTEPTVGSPLVLSRT